VTRRELSFSLMLMAAMALSTVTLFIIAVAASDLQNEFGISKLQIGLLGAANTGVGGLFAPPSGWISDRLGGRRSVALTFVTSGIAAALFAVSPNYTVLLISCAIAGIPQGLGNPACNTAIATGISASKRGIATAIKQSGVQVGIFLAGFLVPWLSEGFGWRSSLWLTAAASFACLAGMGAITVLERISTPDATAATKDIRLDPVVTQVAVYGFLLGIVGGGLGRFLPLFAEEEVGFTVQQAGWVFGLQGLVAIPFRLLSGLALDRGISARRMLTVMGVGGAGAMLFILSAGSGPIALLWIGTVLGGMTLGTWNTPANVWMIRQGAGAGQATGRLMLGFLIGLTVGGPVTGWSIDNFAYTPAWVGGAILSLAGAAIVAYRRKATPTRSVA